MKIVFCTTCKGRAQHVERTLPLHLEHNQHFKDFKVVLLDYNSGDHLLPYLGRNHAHDIDRGRLVVYSTRDQTSFRMSHAKNMAHRLAIREGADVLVNMDADNWAAPGFARWLDSMFRSGQEFLWTNAKSVCGRARQGLAGRIAVSRNLFLEIGGYDERFKVWAPEDEDFKCRVRRLIGEEGERIPDQFLYVIAHKDGLRFKEYPEAKPTPESEAAALKGIREASTTIANFGNFGCGTVYRNFGDAPIELGPVPTRIFGIGTHKTGTTSLHTALKLLGIDSAHWAGPWWAKKVWEEMQALGRSLTLEREYALSDLPFSILYREIDRAYPGSKFILTVRDEDRWLRSIRNHWSPLNPWRKTWDQDCFTHRVHHQLYGRRTFDAEIMLAAYRRHNAEVCEYFKNRPDDLLVMDMDQGAGWHELCTFLKCGRPAESYPRAFVTEGTR